MNCYTSCHRILTVLAAYPGISDQLIAVIPLIDSFIDSFHPLGSSLFAQAYTTASSASPPESSDLRLMLPPSGAHAYTIASSASLLTVVARLLRILSVGAHAYTTASSASFAAK